MFNKQHQPAPSHSLPEGSGTDRSWVSQGQQEMGWLGEAMAASSGLAKGLWPWQRALSQQDGKGRITNIWLEQAVLCVLA